MRAQSHLLSKLWVIVLCVLQAGAVVQQSLSQIRTVAAYNGEEAAAKEYDSKLDLPQKVCMLYVVQDVKQDAM